MTKFCPQCGTENPDTRWICIACGENLSDVRGEHHPAVRSQTPRAASHVTSSTPPTTIRKVSFPAKYSTMRGIASFCNTIATIVLVIAIIGAIAGLIVMFSRWTFTLGLGILIASLLIGSGYYVVLKVIAEGIQVLIDIEMNTRQAATYSRFSAEASLRQEKD